MRIQFKAGCALVMLISLSGAGQTRQKDDKDALQGNWVPVEQSDTANCSYERLVFKGETLTFHALTEGQPERAETKFKLDPKAEPKAIDFIPTKGGAKAKTYLGIYEITDGRLKIWYRGPGEARPEDFNRRAARVYFIVLKLQPSN